MRKAIVVVVVLSVVAFAISGIVSATEKEAKGKVEFGNTICPISGEEIKPGEAFKYEHEGVIYNLCCKACVKDFKKDPEKYIAKLQEKEKWVIYCPKCGAKIDLAEHCKMRKMGTCPMMKESQPVKEGEEHKEHVH